MTPPKKDGDSLYWVGKRYWVVKMGMWFDFVHGWQPTIPEPLILPLAQIVLKENPGSVLVDGAA